MSSLDIRADQRQTQTLSPRLQHAVRLLQMSSLDFAAMLRETLSKNPFLEADEAGSGDEAYEEPTAAEDAEVPASADLPQAMAGDAAAPSGETAAAPEAAAALPDDRELWAGDSAGQRGAELGDVSPLDLMSADTSLSAHLLGQLHLLPLPPRDLALAGAIVESLDDDGYLRTPLEELREVLELEPPADPVEMQIALKRVQSLDPAGVAARSVGECLLLQLPAIACPETQALARTIVNEHLSLLASRDVLGLARRLDEPAFRVAAVCDRIRRLDPRPGWRHGASRIDYVVPDVLVRKQRGQWTVQLNPAIVPRVRLNQVYAQLFQRHRSKANAEMGAHLNEARWMMRNVEQRFSTIVDVAEAIVRRQHNFLDYGAMAMKPLGLREIAQEVGVHESTVSRVTNNKYMATPVGVFELKHFFSRAMTSANGSACSGTAIRELIKDIIEGERAEAPWSDAEITRQLSAQGLKVARRTVTKYRQMLKIEAVDRRRRLV